MGSLGTVKNNAYSHLTHVTSSSALDPSYLSVICTVLVGLSVANVIIEEAIITDIALLSLFLAIFARMTFVNAAATGVEMFDSVYTSFANAFVSTRLHIS